MSILAFDWGQKFVGYASADPEGIVIQARGVIPRAVSQAQTWKLVKSDVPKIQKVIQEWEAEKIILGFPLKANGVESPASQSAQSLAAEIESALKIPVLLIDEHLTSWEAKGKNKHAEAAALILKNYFEESKRKLS